MIRNAGEAKDILIEFEKDGGDPWLEVLRAREYLRCLREGEEVRKLIEGIEKALEFGVSEDAEKALREFKKSIS